jgi:hypothetical protein
MAGVALPKEITVRRFAALAALLVLPFLLLPAGAAADPPFRVPDRVTDRAGALDAAGRARVAEAVDRLRADRGYDLFVVYVRSFDGRDGQQWADATATASQLGRDQVLLAVATGDRVYGLSVDDGFPESDASIVRVRHDALEPALARGDWAGAAVGLADGLRETGSGVSIPLLVGGGVVVAGGAAWLVSRRRRPSPSPAPAPVPAGPPDPAPGESTETLAYRASQALLQVDDAVGTSERELSAARAHFGEEAVAGFAAALEASRADMLAAFEIRQRLDDEVPETEAEQRASHAEIIRLATQADDRLDAQVDAFDRLRALEADAGGYVDGVAARLFGLIARVPEAERAWAELAARWATTALEPVADHLPQARALLADAQKELDEARTRLAASQPAYAVVDGRAAEDAATQAETLLDGLTRRGTELTEAAGRVPAARAGVEQDLAEAAALPGVDAGVLARARAVVKAADLAARGSGDGPGPGAGASTTGGAPGLPDPIAALRLLDEAGAALDAAIAGARETAERARRTSAALQQALVTARSAVAAAADFVSTRRGAVGATARTRLAEAQRHLAAATAGGDAAAALREAQQAEARAQEALELARADVSRWSGPSGGGSGFGGELGALVLGGILSEAMRGGGYRGGLGGGGGVGGGAVGGGGRGGRVPGSFGGSSSRGRRGGGGRF